MSVKPKVNTGIPNGGTQLRPSRSKDRNKNLGRLSLGSTSHTSILIQGEDPKKSIKVMGDGTMTSTQLQFKNPPSTPPCDASKFTYEVNSNQDLNISVFSPLKRGRVNSMELCLKCDHLFTDSDTKVRCSVCDHMACFSCSKLTPMLKQLAKDDALLSNGITWMCISCQRGLPSLSEISNISKTLTVLKEQNEVRLTAIESRLDKFETTMETTLTEKMKATSMLLTENAILDITQRIDNTLDAKTAQLTNDSKSMIDKLWNTKKDDIVQEIDSNISQKFNNDISSKLQSLVEKEVTRKLESMHLPPLETVKEFISSETTKIENKINDNIKTKLDDAQSAIQLTDNTNLHQTVREIKEREDRKNNILVFKLPETTTNAAENTPTTDIDHFMSMCTSMTVNITADDILDHRRLGLPGTGKTRPLLVKLRNVSVKSSIFKNLNKLKNTTYSQLSLANDLTKAQRLAEKELRDKAKSMADNDTSNNFSYKVVGPPWRREIKVMPKKDQTATEASLIPKPQVKTQQDQKNE